MIKVPRFAGEVPFNVLKDAIVAKETYKDGETQKTRTLTGDEAFIAFVASRVLKQIQSDEQKTGKVSLSDLARSYFKSLLKGFATRFPEKLVEVTTKKGVKKAVPPEIRKVLRGKAIAKAEREQAELNEMLA